MSFSFTLFGPSHYWWKWDNKGNNIGGYRVKRYWFNKPDEHSSGGVGFCFPGVHMVFCWGRNKGRK